MTIPLRGDNRTTTRSSYTCRSELGTLTGAAPQRSPATVWVVGMKRAWRRPRQVGGLAEVGTSRGKGGGGLRPTSSEYNFSGGGVHVSGGEERLGVYLKRNWF
jgi:hypothetical protein